jgi:hypothetical protein
MDSRAIQHGGRAVPQVLVSWAHSDPTAMTWEDMAVLCQRYPDALAWEQSSPEGGGHVMAQPQPNTKEQVKTTPAQDQVSTERKATPEIA